MEGITISNKLPIGQKTPIRSSFQSGNVSGTPEYSRIEEVIPIQDHGSEIEVFSYKRVKIELLSKAYLETIYRLLNTQQKTVIMETPKYFMIQYGTEAITYINRETGRFCSSSDFHEEESQKQAGFVIRILNKHDLIDDMHYARVKKCRPS